MFTYISSRSTQISLFELIWLEERCTSISSLTSCGRVLQNHGIPACAQQLLPRPHPSPSQWVFTYPPLNSDSHCCTFSHFVFQSGSIDASSDVRHSLDKAHLDVGASPLGPGGPCSIWQVFPMTGGQIGGLVGGWVVGCLVVFCANTETVPTMRVTRSSSLALISILFFTEECTATGSLRALCTDLCPCLCRNWFIPAHE